MRLCLVLLLAAAASHAADPAPLFDAHGCRSCHKIGDRGGNAGPDLTMLGHRRSGEWLDTWLASPRAYKHDTTMPEQGLPMTDRKALAEYLSNQKGQAWGTRRPWDKAHGVLQGRIIYTMAGCVACHGPAGKGGHPNKGAHGNIIPALPALLSTYKKDELLAKLKKGAVPEIHGGPPAEVNMPAWEGVLTASELDALADYLLTIAKTDPKDEF